MTPVFSAVDPSLPLLHLDQVESDHDRLLDPSPLQLPLPSMSNPMRAADKSNFNFFFINDAYFAFDFELYFWMKNKW